MVTACMSHLTIADVNRKVKLLQQINRENSGGAERRREGKMHLSNLLGTLNLECILAERCRHHQEASWIRQHMGQTKWLAWKLTPLPQNLREQATWQSGSPGSPHPFLMKSFAFAVPASPWAIHFWVLNKSSLSDPRRGPLSCNRSEQYKSVLFHIWLLNKLIHTSNKWLEKWEIKISPLFYWRNLIPKRKKYIQLITTGKRAPNPDWQSEMFICQPQKVMGSKVISF